jgi:hypothetical protein
MEQKENRNRNMKEVRNKESFEATLTSMGLILSNIRIKNKM